MQMNQTNVLIGSSKVDYDSLSNDQQRPVFVSGSNLDTKYKCIYCKLPLVAPMQLYCGHRICQACFENLKKDKEILQCPSNDPECENTEKFDQVFHDKSHSKEMLRLEVYCSYNEFGCQENMPWGKLKEHEVNCSYREKICDYCDERILSVEFNTHKNEKCPKAPATCPYKCSTKIINRSELNDHLKTCSNRPSFCKFQNSGCLFEGSNEEVQKHEADKLNHLDLVFRAIEQSENVKTEHIHQIQNLQSQLEIERENYIKLKTENDLRFETLNNTATMLRTEMENMRKKFEEVEKQQVNVIEIKNNIEKLSTTVVSNTLPEQLRERFYQHDETIAEHDKILTAQDLRLQCLETVNYTGELIWKITDYKRRKQQAITGQVVSLYSQPFYTDCYGYKMCARVYLNGDGIGKGTHLSLFFVVMQGDFDDILKWPFTQRVSFMLLDIKTHQRHLIDSFKPDRTSSSFHKPTSAMNIASGCPLFVSHIDLESKDEMYLRNNVCYLKIVVEKEIL